MVLVPYFGTLLYVLNHDCHHYMQFCSSVYVSARLQAVLTSLLLLMTWHSMTNCQLTCQGPIWGFKLPVRVKGQGSQHHCTARGRVYASLSVCLSVSGHKNEQFEQISNTQPFLALDKWQMLKYLMHTSQTTVVEDMWKASFFDFCPNYWWTKPHHKISYTYLAKNSRTKICEKQAFLISAQIIGEQNLNFNISHYMYLQYA